MFAKLLINGQIIIYRLAFLWFTIIAISEAKSLISSLLSDFQAALNLEPSNHKLKTSLRIDKVRLVSIICSMFRLLIDRVQIGFQSEPAFQRVPPEIWQIIAQFIPRYHLRTWLFVSSFHRDIAMQLIFHTVDLYFGEDTENLNRGLDICDRIKADPVFAGRVKTLRLHWSYEEGDMSDLVARKFHLL